MDLYFLLCFKCWPSSSSVRWHCLGWVSLDMGAVCLNGTRWEGRTSESVKSGMHLWRWGVNVGKVSWAENKIFWSLFFGSTKCTTHVLICVGGSYKWCIYFAHRHLLCTNHVPVDVHALGIDNRDPYDRAPELKKLKTRQKGPKPFRIPLTWHAWYLANSVHCVLWDHSSHFIDVEAKASFSVELVWVSQLEREKLDFEPGLSHSRTLLSFHKAMQQVTPSLRCHLFKKSIHFITFLD